MNFKEQKTKIIERIQAILLVPLTIVLVPLGFLIEYIIIAPFFVIFTLSTAGAMLRTRLKKIKVVASFKKFRLRAVAAKF